MKRIPFARIGCLALFFTAGGFAQNYSVRPSAVAGGGGASAGGNFRVVGTVGQHEASGQLTGGTPEAVPSLNIAFADSSHTNVAVSWTLKGGNYTVNGGLWPMPVATFTLLQNSNLLTTNWTLAPQASVGSPANPIVLAPSTNGNMFYRLKR